MRGRRGSACPVLCASAERPPSESRARLDQPSRARTAELAGAGMNFERVDAGVHDGDVVAPAHPSSASGCPWCVGCSRRSCDCSSTRRVSRDNSRLVPARVSSSPCTKQWNGRPCHRASPTPRSAPPADICRSAGHVWPTREMHPADLKRGTRVMAGAARAPETPGPERQRHAHDRHRSK